MKAEVQLIRKLLNEMEVVLGYEVSLFVELPPDVKIGNYEVKFKELK